MDAQLPQMVGLTRVGRLRTRTQRGCEGMGSVQDNPPGWWWRAAWRARLAVAVKGWNAQRWRLLSSFKPPGTPRQVACAKAHALLRPTCLASPASHILITPVLA